MCICFIIFCFFKQKTAYEMRISDWSSDVCSSDLLNNAILPSEDCLDNGAALQWNRTIAAHGSVSLQTAVSFGDIPSFAQFNVTAVSPASGAQGTGVDVTLTGIGFDADTSFASGFGDGITVSNEIERASGRERV